MILKLTYNNKSICNYDRYCLTSIHSIVEMNCLRPEPGQNYVYNPQTFILIHLDIGVTVSMVFGLRRCFTSHTLYFLIPVLAGRQPSQVFCIHEPVPQPTSTLWCSPAIFWSRCLAEQTSWIQLCLIHKQAGNVKDYKFKICQPKSKL